jgi:AsmA protein
MNRAVRIGVIALGVLFPTRLILTRLLNVDSLRPRLEAELTGALGRPVAVGNLSISVFSGTVSADNIAIGDDAAFSRHPFLTAKSFKASVKIMPLIFSKTLHVTGITLDEPQISLLRGANGAWNFSSIGTGPADAPRAEPKADEFSGGALSVDKINIEKGRLLVGVAIGTQAPAVYNNVSLEVRGFSSTAQFPFTLTTGLPGGGDLSLEGKCGPISAGNTGATPFEASLKLRKLDLAASGFAAPSTGIAGVADLDGAIRSMDQQVSSSGTLKAEKLKLASTGAPMKRAVELKYALEHNLKTGSGTLTQGDVAIGKAVTRVKGTWRTEGKAATLNTKINGDGMPVDDLEAALPALGVVLPSGSRLQGGTVSVDLAVAGPSDKLVITGLIRLSSSRLAGFDLGSKLSAIPALSGKQTGGKNTTIQNFSTTMRMSPQGTQADAINIDIAALGVVAGAGSVSSSGALDFAMTADLSGRTGVIPRTGIGGQGGGVPFSIQGTASDPKFVPDIKSMAGNAIARKVSSSVPDNPLPGIRSRRR